MTVDVSQIPHRYIQLAARNRPRFRITSEAAADRPIKTIRVKAASFFGQNGNPAMNSANSEVVRARRR